MDEKRCTTCHVVRPSTDFNVRRNAPDGRQPRCRECAAAWYVTNRAAHKAKVLARNNRVRAENQALLIAYLLEHPCVDCGEQDVRVLEFDHLDPAQKRGTVTRLLGSGFGWDRIEEEIRRCSVRCANCHRRRTADMFGYGRSAAERDRRAALQERAQARLQTIVAAPA